MIERKNYPALATPLGPYVHAVKHQGLLYLSGLTAIGGKAEQDNLIVQAESIFEQIQVILDSENIGFEHILKVTIFVTELEELPLLREWLFQRYNSHLPACSLVQVSSLIKPTLKIELEAVFITS